MIVYWIHLISDRPSGIQLMNNSPEKKKQHLCRNSSVVPNEACLLLKV